MLVVASLAFGIALACLFVLVSAPVRRLVLDRPNERSLHAIPVPRTDGLAIVAGVAGSLAYAGSRELGPLFLTRLYWHTIEFGLMRTADGMRAYGAGLLSSSGEIAYAVDSPEPKRVPFDVLTAMRTPYKIDS